MKPSEFSVVLLESQEDISKFEVCLPYSWRKHWMGLWFGSFRKQEKIDGTGLEGSSRFLVV